MSEETQPLTKEEWRERIQREGKEETIKQEMIRLGFWTDKPLTPEEMASVEADDQAEAALKSELNKLRSESRKWSDTDQLIKKARQKRIEESKQRRAERKKARAIERKQQEERWAEYRQNHLVHLGNGVSGGLEQSTTNQERLKQLDLPLIETPQQLASEMGITLGRLKWLTYHRDLATLSHYYPFTIPKKNGGIREISAPKKELRAAQAWVKQSLLDQLSTHPAAYGFVQGRNTVDHAKQHLNQAIVVKMDLADFFPTITFYRVRGLFASFGYSQQMSTVFALLCTEPPRKRVRFDGTYYYVAMGERQLPQGASTSPAITNLICQRLDQRLSGLAEKENFIYSRYADDLTFSTSDQQDRRVGALLQTVRQIIHFEGFQPNEAKTRILRKSRRQRVTGIVVNEKANLSRQDQRRFRAILHNVGKNGFDIENRDHHDDFLAYLQGYISYAHMVRPDLAETWQNQLDRAIAAHLKD
ncbi:RNA-directed DNA polymerase [Seinonella peptonophila]|uniref:RNA-directed DNA polymerase n=1 Tax=Seinonella peptonophila TaxID=112248 RepID=A0A1M4YCR6_9BACL|nr:reverse transcriptase family protein [Seinonella peptonophila]SHF03594.1 RNA-directed DNA polymerase [Seinonella peptonophila]